MNGTVAPVTASYAHTIAGKVVAELHDLYNIIEERQKKWLAAAPDFTCPTGCGKCCHHFEPDILECEALYMASWLLCSRRDRALEFAQLDEIPGSAAHSDGCPLQTDSEGLGSGAQNGGSCGIYGGRALVCRLFGYCGDTGRNGKPRFKVCKHHPLSVLHKELREYSEFDLLCCFGELPPLMAEFGSKAAQLMPESAGHTELLRTALPRALRKLLMLENLHRSALFAEALAADENNGDDNDRPNPTPNLPKAG